MGQTWCMRRTTLKKLAYSDILIISIFTACFNKKSRIRKTWEYDQFLPWQWAQYRTGPRPASRWWRRRCSRACCWTCRGGCGRCTAPPRPSTCTPPDSAPCTSPVRIHSNLILVLSPGSVHTLKKMSHLAILECFWRRDYNKRLLHTLQCW